MSEPTSRAYDPAAIEGKQYEGWLATDCFAAPVDSDAPPFTLTIPPPNVTGELHMGHALQHVIHDTLLRRKRMQGFNVLCLPGTDHAGISTNI
ncbi:MAG: class I tRNA ligase family protein, partial [Armatimonadetes bacterium]|nr:class I tRNA ligase family protein [Armatimonadota bacterium]